MRQATCLLTCLLGAAVLSGCAARYRASAIVEVRLDGARVTRAVIDAEIAAIRELAPALVSADWSYDIRRFRDTNLLEISVTAPDPTTAATQCNRLLEQYASMTNAPVRRAIVQRASVPRARL